MKKILTLILSGTMIFAMTAPVLTEEAAAENVETDENSNEDSVSSGSVPDLPVNDTLIGEDSEGSETEDISIEEAGADEYGIAPRVISGITDSKGQYEGADVYKLEDAAAYCIDLMKDRKIAADDEFLVAVDYKVSDLNGASPYTYAYNQFQEAYNEAFNNSLFVDGKGGDSLLYSMYGKPFYITRYCTEFNDGEDGISLVWATRGKATYYTSTSEEDAYRALAAQALDLLNVWNASDYDKVCAIFDYICENIKYSYSAAGSSGYGPYTAWAALCEKRAVCQGYSNLFYYMCNELGVPCRIVAGLGNNGVETGAHAWNIVKLDGKWYNVDVTWGASYNSWYPGRYFFLEGSDNFDQTDSGLAHTADYMTGIYYIDYTSEPFTTDYPISETDYCAHNWQLVATQEPVDSATNPKEGYNIYKCSICGETYDEVLHAHEWKVTSEPNCGTGTVGSETCVNCGYTQSIPAKHTWEVVHPLQEATCTKDGYNRLKQCSECGAVDSEDNGEVIPSGHVIRHMAYCDATEYEEGNIEYWVCDLCGTCFSDAKAAKVIPFESTVLTYQSD